MTERDRSRSPRATTAINVLDNTEEKIWKATDGRDAKRGASSRCRKRSSNAGPGPAKPDHAEPAPAGSDGRARGPVSGRADAEAAAGARHEHGDAGRGGHADT